MVKVIFLENVGQYKIGQIKEVPDGYARNFLLKRNLAKIATEAEINNLQSKIKKLEEIERKKIAKAQELAKRLKKIKVIVRKEVNDEGHLYGSVTPKDIAEAINNLKFNLNPADIIIENQIKTLGEFPFITIRVGHGIEVELAVKVIKK